MAFATFCPARSFLPHTNTSLSLERGIALAAAKFVLDLHDHGPRPQALPSRHTSPLQNDDGLMVGAFCPLYSSLKTVHVASRRLSVKGVMASMAMDGSNGAPSCDIDNTNAVADEGGCRKGEVTRMTKETQVSATIWLDGTGQCDCSTGIPFLDHMLDQIASHGLFDLIVKAKGDTHIDDHHTNEDIALALGTALAQALGDRKGINRFGFFSAPLDEALVHVTVDLCGRPHLTYRVQIPTERVGTYDTQLVKHFFQSLVNTSGMTLHIHQVEGENSHHIIEATFKAFARALRAAIEFDPRRSGKIPSSKGVLSQK